MDALQQDFQSHKATEGDDVLLTTRAVARRLGLTARTLQRWRKDGRGPRWIRLGEQKDPRWSGGAIRYESGQVERWLRQMSRGRKAA